MLNKRGHTSDVNIQLAENGNRASAEYAIPIFDLRYEAVDFSALFLMKPGKIPGLNSFQ